jgi:cyclic pyranopterin phosphate synthase
MSTLVDTFGRVVENLRISVTDRCNFRCRYCMPEDGVVWLKKERMLTYEEIERLVRIVSGLGVWKVRLTGGEPLMRKELWKLVRMLHTMPGIHDIALTTNGYFLKDQVGDLVAAGLGRVNVSLDALSYQTFTDMARREFFARTWEGIEEADRLGLSPIKLNVVLIRGVNDGEIARFAELARTRRFVVRFIEFMPIGKDDKWMADKVVRTAEVLERINRYARLVTIPKNGQRAPEKRFVFEDGKGEVGFISSVSEPFCGDCNRVRLTSDGQLRTCLFSHRDTDLRALLRGGGSDEQIAQSIRKAVWAKEEGHRINDPGFVRPRRTMSQIGG